jgi:flagellar protein FlgJ
MKQLLIAILSVMAILAYTDAQAQSIPMPASADIGMLHAGVPKNGRFAMSDTRFKRLSDSQREAKVLDQAKQYEVVLMAKMLEQAVPDGKNSMLFGGGHGSDIYRSMVIEEYAKSMVDDGGFGLTGQIAKEMAAANRR